MNNKKLYIFSFFFCNEKKMSYRRVYRIGDEANKDTQEKRRRYLFLWFFFGLMMLAIILSIVIPLAINNPTDRSSNVTSCVPDPCLNGGICYGNNLCNCTGTGYTGSTCETAIDDDCNPNPCLNGGTCVDGAGVGNFTCNCPTGFTGTLCEINIDDCNPNPCLNGGMCVDGINSFTCICLSNFTGTLCEDMLVAGLQPTIITETPTSITVNVTGSFVDPMETYYSLFTLHRPGTMTTYYANESPNAALAPVYSVLLEQVTFPVGPQQGDLITHGLYDGPNTNTATLIVSTTLEYQTVPSILIGFDTQLAWTGTDYGYYPLQIGGLAGTVVNNLNEYVAFADTTYFSGIGPRPNDGILSGLSADIGNYVGTVRVGRPDKYMIIQYLVTPGPKNQAFWSLPMVGYNAILPISYNNGVPTGPHLFGHNTDVDWGDGNIEVFGTTTTNRISVDSYGSQDHRVLAHNYAATGTYTIRMAGFSHHWSQRSLSAMTIVPFGDPTNAVVNIIQYGDYITQTFDMNACAQMTSTPTATDAPNPSLVNINYMFDNCPTWNLDVSGWSLPNVQTAIAAFGERNMNASVSSLGMGSLQNGLQMFSGATFGFAGPVGVRDWSLNALTDNGIFEGAIISASNQIRFPAGMTIANRLFKSATIADSTTIDLSLVQAGIFNMVEMFNMCTFTAAPDMTTWSFPAAYNANLAFANINNLGAIPNLNPVSLVFAGQMFMMSTFPTVGPSTSTWTFPNLSNALQMFMGCGGAAFSINATGWGMNSLTTINEGFRSTSTITVLDVSTWSVTALQRFQQVWQSSSIITVDVTNWDFSNVFLAQYAFLTTTTNVVGIAQMETQGILSFNSMFDRYTGSVIDVSNWDTSGGFSSFACFSRYLGGPCNVTLWDTSMFTDISQTFSESNCNPDISGWNVGAVTSASNIVSNCLLSQTNYDTVLVQLDATGVSGGIMTTTPRSNTIVSVLPVSPAPVAQFYTAAPSAAATARANLIGNGWTLVDGGPI